MIKFMQRVRDKKPILETLVPSLSLLNVSSLSASDHVRFQNVDPSFSLKLDWSLQSMGM